jgi:type IV secretory pathway TrbD component
MSDPWFYPEGHSDCCEACVWNGICSKCHEHCGLLEDEAEDGPGPDAAMETELANVSISLCGQPRYIMIRTGATYDVFVWGLEDWIRGSREEVMRRIVTETRAILAARQQPRIAPQGCESAGGK